MKIRNSMNYYGKLFQTEGKGLLLQFVEEMKSGERDK